MKEIKAFVRPDKVDELYHGLKENGFCCMTVTEAEGTGNYTDPRSEFPSLNHPFLHGKVAKIEIVAKEENVDRIVKLIHDYGHTGDRGDGLIYVSSLDNVYRVRDLEEGEKILKTKVDH